MGMLNNHLHVLNNFPSEKSQEGLHLAKPVLETPSQISWGWAWVLGCIWGFFQDNIRADTLASRFQVILTDRRAATTESPKQIAAGDCRIFVCVQVRVLWEFPSPCTETSSCSSQCRVTLCSQASANTGEFASYHGPRFLEVRRFSFHHLDGHNTKGPNVHLGAVRRTGDNFWGHPVSSAHHGAGRVLLRAELSAEAKIS